MPLLLPLDGVLDKRLVRTLLQCLVAIMRLRTHPQALWLWELGSYVQGYDDDSASAPAGTKRVGKLLRSVKWTVGRIDRYLLQKAASENLEGLCPVLSSQANRNAYRPKQATRSNTRIEIVDLIGKIARDNLPLI